MVDKSDKKIDWDTIIYYILVVILLAVAMYVLGITESIFLIGIAAVIGIVIGLIVLLIRRNL